MDAGTCKVEVSPDERSVGRKLVTCLFYEVIGNLSDDAGVHTIKVSAQGSVLDDHGLERDVTGTLADTEE